MLSTRASYEWPILWRRSPMGPQRFQRRPLRKNPRYTKCGHCGGPIRPPCHSSSQMVYSPFAVELGVSPSCAIATGSCGMRSNHSGAHGARHRSRCSGSDYNYARCVSGGDKKRSGRSQGASQTAESHAIQILRREKDCSKRSRWLEFRQKWRFIW
jgi:hypothetical protein